LEIHLYLFFYSEFTIAEIEHFLDPLDKTHPKFETVADLEIPLYSAIDQTNGHSAQLVRLDDAVRSRLINNETLGFFIGRIYLFLIKIGIDKNRIRFRQHMKNEMAHYACDCWDAECKISYGWIECVGCADRSSYDLTQHAKCSGHGLVAQRQLPIPKRIQISARKINDKVIGQVFRKDTSTIKEILENLSETEARILHEKLEQGYGSIDFSRHDHCFFIR
jgi:glycyl-tRNA synthetase